MIEKKVEMLGYNPIPLRTTMEFTSCGLDEFLSDLGSGKSDHLHQEIQSAQIDFMAVVWKILKSYGYDLVDYANIPDYADEKL